jgi:hypothetical protein
MQHNLQQIEETPMSPAPKNSQVPSPEEIHAEASEFGANLVGLFLKSVERFAELQKQSIDVAVQQSAEMSDVVKKMTEKLPGAPRPVVFDLATGNVARCADTQKSAITFVVEQSKAMTDTLKDRSLSAKDLTESNSKAVKQTLERSFAVNKKVLENTAAGAKAMLDAAKDQFGLRGTQAEAMTDSFIKGIDTAIDAQKKVMDIAAA